MDFPVLSYKQTADLMKRKAKETKHCDTTTRTSLSTPNSTDDLPIYNHQIVKKENK